MHNSLSSLSLSAALDDGLEPKGLVLEFALVDVLKMFGSRDLKVRGPVLCRVIGGGPE